MNFKNIIIATNLLFSTVISTYAKEKIPELKPVHQQVQQYQHIDQSTQMTVFVKSIQQASEAETIKMLVAAYETVQYDKFIELAVNAIAKVENANVIAKILLPLIEKCGKSAVIDVIAQLSKKISSTKLIEIIAAIHEKVDKITFIETIVTAIEQSKYIDSIKLQEWYYLVPFDSGTGCWAIATKAKKYADEGNTQKVAEMLKLYIKLLQENYKE